MTQVFFYSVLVYRPSHVTAEQINIGVLAIFARDESVYFLKPEGKNLRKRIKSFYPNAGTGTVETYVKLFEKKAERLSGNLKSYLGNFDSLISDHFLTENGASIRFTPWEKAPVWGGEEQSLLCLHQQLLGGYEVPRHSAATIVHNEAYVRRRLKELLRESFGRHQKTDTGLYLKEEKKVLTAGPASIEVESFWKNGTVNWVLPFGLDLHTEERIADKCFALAKSVELLSQKALREEIRFDVLVTKPSQTDLLDIYHQALRVLENATDKQVLKVVRPEGLPQYAEDVAEKAVELT
jgi:hypothetical protein